MKLSDMTAGEFEGYFRVKLRPKGMCASMRLLGEVIGDAFLQFWTTYRLPFQSVVTISYPDSVNDPMDYPDILDHELFHVSQFRPPFAPIACIALAGLVPLPWGFSGRWFLERGPYLNDIRKGRRTIDEVVTMLWNDYGYAWPPPLMRKWFQKQLGVTDGV